MSQNVERALGASRCDQYVGPVGVVTGCGWREVDIRTTYSSGHKKVPTNIA